MEVDVIILMGT